MKLGLLCLSLLLVASALSADSFDGHDWRDLHTGSKVMFVWGIVSAIDTFANSARWRGEDADRNQQLFDVTKSITAIVLSIDAFFEEPENRSFQVMYAFLVVTGKLEVWYPMRTP